MTARGNTLDNGRLPRVRQTPARKPVPRSHRVARFCQTQTLNVNGRISHD